MIDNLLALSKPRPKIGRFLIDVAAIALLSVAANLYFKEEIELWAALTFFAIVWWGSVFISSIRNFVVFSSTEIHEDSVKEFKQELMHFLTSNDIPPPGDYDWTNFTYLETLAMTSDNEDVRNMCAEIYYSLTGAWAQLNNSQRYDMKRAADETIERYSKEHPRLTL